MLNNNNNKIKKYNLLLLKLTEFRKILILKNKFYN